MTGRSARSSSAASHPRKGDTAGAQEAAARVLSLSEQLYTSVLEGGTEAEAIAAAGFVRASLLRYIGLFDDDADDDRTYAALLRWKGASRRAMVLRREEMLVQGDAESTELLSDLAAIRQRLAATVLSEELDAESRATTTLDLERERNQLERALASRSSGLAAAWSDASLDDIQAALDPDVALVDYSVAGTAGSFRLTAFVVTREGLQRVDLPVAPSDVRAAVQTWRERLVGASFSPRVDAAGTAVRELLWDPVVPALGGRDRVIVVPTGSAATVPWAALPVGGGRYLVEDVTLAYLDRAQDVVPRTDRSVGEGALVVGGVDYGQTSEDGLVAMLRGGSGGFGALPGATEEAESVVKRLQRYGEVDYLTGDAPTERVTEAAIEGRRYVHVATHGFFIPSGEREAAPVVRSGLVLAGANATHDLAGEDGLWTADEVATVDLRATELVVLSACET